MAPPRIAEDWEVLRLRLLLAGMLGAFLLLAAALYSIQVAHGHRYETNLAEQSIRRVRLPGVRGGIYDREGRALAENRPSYCVAIYLEELRQKGKWARTIDRVEATRDLLAARLGLPPQLTREAIQTHVRKRLPLPLLAWRDVGEEVVARWAERASNLPGVDIYPEAVRVYPQGVSAAHVLGYVGQADIASLDDESYNYYLPEMAGKTGLEKVYDDLLRGEAGGRMVRVDVSGFRHEDLGGREPRAGQDLQLTLDLRAQQLAEQALEGVNGALVMLDPSNGEVLAMASSPSFNPNAFIPRILQADWDVLNTDTNTPLLNRAVAGAYPPGSTFKPVTAMAALESGRAVASQRYTCSGAFHLGRATFRCWDHNGHGTITLREAIKYSCNVYQFNLALHTGLDPLVQTAHALGFGEPTGIDLDYEVRGLLPDDAWKRRTQRDGWRDGDTCNLAIGQGFLTATPLQVAVLAAALANGGTRVHPHLLKGVRARGEPVFRPRPVAASLPLGWHPARLRDVREGMRDVVMASDGTGRKVRVPGIEMAGKTGTAEIGRKEEGRKLGWMMVFAPYDQPRVAVAMVVEEAVSGGSTVAPRLQRMLAAFFGAPDGEGGRG